MMGEDVEARNAKQDTLKQLFHNFSFISTSLF